MYSTSFALEITVSRQSVQYVCAMYCTSFALEITVSRQSYSGYIVVFQKLTLTWDIEGIYIKYTVVFEESHTFCCRLIGRPLYPQLA
jgi:hypothetical protein